MKALIIILVCMFAFAGQIGEVQAKKDTGWCIAQCAQDRGDCISYCEGNGQCIAHCQQAYAQCAGRGW